MKTKFNSFFLAISFLFLWNVQAYSAHYFVKSTVSTSGDGLSWDTSLSSSDFETKLSSGIFGNGDIIFLSGGVYKPSINGFSVTSGLTLIGGYDPAVTGTVTTIPTYPSPTPTIFSGDLNSDNLANSGDVQNIVIIQSLNPVTIQGIQFSYAYYDGTMDETAGAVIAKNTTVNFKNCIFDSNKAPAAPGAGGLTAISCYTHIMDCVFTNNAAEQKGGAIRLINYISDGTAAWTVIERCQISGNRISTINTGVTGSGKLGGGIQLTSGILWVINSTITNNEARMNGAGISVDEGSIVRVISSTFANNRCSNFETGGSRSYGTSLSFAKNTYLNIVNSISVENTDNGDSYNPTFYTRDLTNFASVFYQSFGNNITGTFWFNNNDNQWSSDLWETTDNTSRLGEGYHINKYSTVFGSNMLEDNGGFSKTIKTSDAIPGANVNDLSTLVNTTWRCPVNANLSVDQRGYARQTTTTVGAIDQGAVTQIDNTNKIQHAIIRVHANCYKLISEVQSEAVVYDLMGHAVLKTFTNKTIDLSPFSKGLYLIVSNGSSYKVIR